MATTREVAEWLLDEICAQETLTQKSAIREIERQFGAEFLYRNRNGNLSICEAVLQDFRSIKEDVVAWNNGRRCWEVCE